MVTHADIVRRAGKVEDTAHDRCVSVFTVRSWIARDSIPAEYWKSFVDGGHATLDELAEAAARKRVPPQAA